MRRRGRSPVTELKSELHRYLLAGNARTCFTRSVTVDQAPLSAPLEIGFDYTRSLGPVLSRFVTGLAQRRILGARGADGRVHVPPPEYDPVTGEPLTELVEVGQDGTVVTWCAQPKPLAGQPLQRPFAWALITLDGADTPLLIVDGLGAVPMEMLAAPHYLAVFENENAVRALSPRSRHGR